MPREQLAVVNESDGMMPFLKGESTALDFGHLNLAASLQLLVEETVGFLLYFVFKLMV